ncbi:hypothetical protein FNE39_05380 [Helicobacter pylori]|nr:hypothetical protein FNE39_05380 [Helicobacter pylori]
MKIKETTCLGLFEIMDSTAKLIAKDKEVVRIREMYDALVNYPTAKAIGLFLASSLHN